ncbi:hypothetical protein [Microbacterium sp. NIBRBAC000506063]|uniref:hypothetical protein n=1 Tax=Microbacterium sp. NIBRBAC000506063 TaxID=2734618 RepID=UPI002948C26F|nr:hypothetical protein [Microbacterium sp. NIBRBAC000506063]
MTLPRPTAQELIAKTQSSHKPHPYAEIQGIRPRGSTQMTLNTPVRSGAALVGIAGMAVLAGCSGAAEAEPQEPRDYADGTYTAEGSYQTPETLEQISVTVTLDDGVIADVEIVGDPQAAESRQFQGRSSAGSRRRSSASRSMRSRCDASPALRSRAADSPRRSPRSKSRPPGRHARLAVRGDRHALGDRDRRAPVARDP